MLRQTYEVNNLAFIAGTPRSGSTLLVSILAQNPKLKAGRMSSLCELMWQTKSVLDSYATATGQQAENHDGIIASIPGSYYQDVDKEIVFDFCRSWTKQANLDLISKYITNRPKIICPFRDKNEVINSYQKLFESNNRTDFFESGFYYEMLDNFDSLEYAMNLNDKRFLFIDYKNLVESPQLVFDNIYLFLGMESFDHDFNNIVCSFTENEMVTGLIGLHDLRKTISWRSL
jgi:sulfotransferase